jgi:hypothetical protein
VNGTPNHLLSQSDTPRTLTVDRGQVDVTPTLPLRNVDAP